MINKIIEAVKNEKMTFGKLDSKIMKFGYKSVCDLDVNMIIESGSVVYEYPSDPEEEVESIEITFSVYGDIDNINTIIKVTNVELY